ncbi:MAG TPA: C45 family autoproteolytic acyltransferase/hydrolase [Candidatus Aminicenantes bacterium]|nr:C45 family autoproteolytic acyltransferase/hydrolase [Candidatus Aminicenantes bacterium]
MGRRERNNALFNKTRLWQAPRRRISIPSFSRTILVVSFALAGLISGCSQRADKFPNKHAELEKGARADTNGWINIHLEGTPRQIGFQHGWLLAAEIDDLMKSLAHFLQGSSKRDWAFYRSAAERMFWPKLEAEYREEIEGIAAGLGARIPKTNYDAIDITALNGWIELSRRYVPYLEEQVKTGAGGDKGAGHCGAFISTGNWTEDGGIVVGLNSWIDYIVGSRWNIIADIAPANGHRVLMDCLPGTIHGGDGLAMNGAGVVFAETTPGAFKDLEKEGAPGFVLARKAAQYAASIDDFVRIVHAYDGGDHSGDWLVGDTKTGEIAKLDAGLGNRRLSRTTDGYFVWPGFPDDGKAVAGEASFAAADKGSSSRARKARWEQLMEEYKGYIDVEDGKLFGADHIDLTTGKEGSNGNVLCGHVDEDPKGMPESGWAPFSPAGSVQGKVTSTALVKEMRMWARMGHPCGRDFVAAEFLAEHPEFAWQKPYLKDLRAQPWTLFEAGK